MFFFPKIYLEVLVLETTTVSSIGWKCFFFPFKKLFGVFLVLEIEGYKTQHRGGNHQDRGERIGGLLFLEQTSSEFFFWTYNFLGTQNLLREITAWTKVLSNECFGFWVPQKMVFFGVLDSKFSAPGAFCDKHAARTCYLERNKMFAKFWRSFACQNLGRLKPLSLGGDK